MEKLYEATVYDAADEAWTVIGRIVQTERGTYEAFDLEATREGSTFRYALDDTTIDADEAADALVESFRGMDARERRYGWGS